MPNYKYGEEVHCSFDLLKSEDKYKLELFSCGNAKLDYFIKNEIIVDNEIINEDGLMFKVENKDSNEIIAVISLAAVKIDVFAVDRKYQKMHYNKESETACDHDEHYYLSDYIMCRVIQHCNEISEEKVLVDYILLYADKHAKRFYDRNLFLEFEEYMQEEYNMEINKNIPMYIKL